MKNNFDYQWPQCFLKEHSFSLNDSKKSTTKLITFIENFFYDKFKSTGLSETMIKIMEKRTYDVAAFTNNANIYFNDCKLNVKSFNNYIDMYINDEELVKVYEKVNNRWDVGICLNEDQLFEGISFVNGINTNKGGKHVDYVVNQITKKLSEFITKKKKLTIKPQFIKDNIKMCANTFIDLGVLNICKCRPPS